jgi:hypothetical protein
VPFLRVIRDKRGYETTYLMHWYRDGQRQRTKILYVFRSPGGLRVGRQVLEPEVMRQLEAQHPEIDFEWSSVRENKQIIDTTPEPRRRPRRGEGEPGARPPKAAGQTAPATATGSAVRRPGQQPAPQPAPPPGRPPIPDAIDGATLDDQIAFLGHWYPQVCERVTLRASDPSRREALLALAERLNTASWTGADAEHIAVRLQQASEALDRLSHVFARRRRRTRKRGDEPAAGADSAAATEADSAAATEADAAAAAEADSLAPAGEAPSEPPEPPPES